MKDIIRITLCILPFMVSGLLYFFFQNDAVLIETEQQKKLEKLEEADRKLEIFENWLQSKRKIFESDFFKKMKLKKDNKEIYFEDLDESKQNVFMLLLFANTKKDLENAEQSDQDQYSQQKIKEAIIIANELILKQKNKLYNLYGNKIHPQDKLFLENLNVYIYK